MPSERFQQVIRKIDEANAADPRRIEADGASLPYELAYSRWMAQWIRRLEPAASEELSDLNGEMNSASIQSDYKKLMALDQSIKALERESAEKRAELDKLA